MGNEDRKKKLWEQREQLSPEGKELWDSMMSDDFDAAEMLQEVKTKATRRSKLMFPEVQTQIKTITIENDETQRIRLELRRLIQNSKMVVQECEALQIIFTNKEQYFKANECKVAGLCHRNLMARLERILDGGTAFEDVPVDQLQLQMVIR